mmetsp:Transcript_538/g.741  ORF Transcript_538/g.741 Transcript_538/m.741 type:complete len:314 (+) Transcript_538:422-1363(+)
MEGRLTILDSVAVLDGFLGILSLSSCLVLGLSHLLLHGLLGNSGLFLGGFFDVFELFGCHGTAFCGLLLQNLPGICQLLRGDLLGSMGLLLGHFLGHVVLFGSLFLDGFLVLSEFFSPSLLGNGSLLLDNFLCVVKLFGSLFLQDFTFFHGELFDLAELLGALLLSKLHLVLKESLGILSLLERLLLGLTSFLLGGVLGRCSLVGGHAFRLVQLLLCSVLGCTSFVDNSLLGRFSTVLHCLVSSSAFDTFTKVVEGLLSAFLDLGHHRGGRVRNGPHWSIQPRKGGDGESPGEAEGRGDGGHVAGGGFSGSAG